MYYNKTKGIKIQTFREWLNTNITESGNSASKVVWRKDGNSKIGDFYVISSKTGTKSTFTIVINKKEKHNNHTIKDIEIYEFKFYDSEGNIELTNNMEFVLGVGPTIKKEFCNLLDIAPEAVIFSADKHEKSRVKHYDKFAEKIAKDYNYEIFFKPAITTSDDEYVLVRKDKIEDFKKNFRTSNL